MGFSKQEYWSGLPCPPPGDLSDPGIKPESLTSSALAGGFFTTSAIWETQSHITDPENVVCRPRVWPLTVVLPPPSCPCDCRVCHVSFQSHPSSQSWGSCSHPTAETGSGLKRLLLRGLSESRSVGSDSL